MNISELCIRRPIMTVLLNAAVIVAGVLAYNNIPIAALPQYDTPTIQVTAVLPGASPAQAERWRASRKTVMSTPISAMTVAAINKEAANFFMRELPLIGYLVLIKLAKTKRSFFGCQL